MTRMGTGRFHLEDAETEDEKPTEANGDNEERIVVSNLRSRCLLAMLYIGVPFCKKSRQTPNDKRPTEANEANKEVKGETAFVTFACSRCCISEFPSVKQITADAKRQKTYRSKRRKRRWFQTFVN